MSHRTIQLSFFGGAAILLFVLLFFIFKPYIGVIFLSAVLSVTFYPMFESLRTRFGGRPALAALVTVLAIVLFIVVPLSILSASLLMEALDLYNKLAFGGGSVQIISIANEFISKIDSLLPSTQFSQGVSVDEYIRSSLNWIIGHTDSFLALIFGGLFKFVLMLLSSFYLLLNGNKIKQILIKWSPLPDKYDEEFVDTLRSSVDAVLRGRILVSVAQGLILGLGFALFGVGNPVLWGFVGAIASLIPIVGTSIVTIPAIAYLLFVGHIGSAIGLLIWSALCVGFVDNVLSFIFFRGRINVHPLIILFSILGGVEFFGVIGFLVGPVVVSAFVALTKIYPFIVPTQRSE